MPGANTPRSASPKAFAAWRVTPASASSGVKRNNVQAMFKISSSEVQGELPGLQSVDKAIATRCWRSRSMGGTLVSRRK